MKRSMLEALDLAERNDTREPCDGGRSVGRPRSSLSCFCLRSRDLVRVSEASHLVWAQHVGFDADDCALAADGGVWGVSLTGCPPG